MSNKRKAPPVSILLSAEDRALFHQAMRGVKRYTGDDRVDFTRPRQQAQGSQTNISPGSERSQRDILSESTRHEAVSGDERLLYIGQGINPSQLKRLKQGALRPGVTLDLHGYSAEEARLALGRLLDQPLSNRCLCVVHGKGYSSDSAAPRLKNLVNSWLRQHPSVIAFCSAQAKDGGTGAVYVLLKRSLSDHQK